MWKVKSYNKDYENIFIRQGKDKLLARLLSQRNIRLDEIDNFLNPSYDKLSHPHTLNGTKEAADIFCQACLNKSKIGVIGDYDADGIISSVMLKELCDVFNVECNVFLPSRFKHGYGLSEEAINVFKQSDPPDLLIISDCGSNNEEEIKELKKIGIKKIILIDHHTIDQSKISKSVDAFISHHLSKDCETFCSCGEVYQFIRSIRGLTKKINPIEFLSYAAIGTIADVVPLNRDNRIIVKNGLKINALNHTVASGLNALINKIRLSSVNLSQEDVQFKIAPRLNAMGRMEEPDFVFDLLVENDYDKALLMVDELERCNNDRKKEQRNIEKQAMSIIKSGEDYKHGIVVYNENWHIGVLGIVAAKLSETFKKPCLVIGKQDDKWKGSGRSIAGFNLKNVLDTCSDMFDDYGGHQGAAGFTVKNDKIDSLNKSFNDACERYYSNNNLNTEDRYYDAELKVQTISVETARMIFDNLHPYSENINPEPIFKISDVIIGGIEEFSGDGWRLFIFRGVKDGQDIKLPFKMFFRSFGAEINGMKADVYFSFPQRIEEIPSLKVVDIVFKK